MHEVCSPPVAGVTIWKPYAEVRLVCLQREKDKGGWKPKCVEHSMGHAAHQMPEGTSREIYKERVEGYRMAV